MLRGTRTGSPRLRLGGSVPLIGDALIADGQAQIGPVTSRHHQLQQGLCQRSVPVKPWRLVAQGRAEADMAHAAPQATSGGSRSGD